MKIFRYIMLGFTSLMLVLSIVAWIVSHFYMHRFYYYGDNAQIAMVIVAGDIGVGAGKSTAPWMRPGFSHERLDIDLWAYDFLRDNTWLGFGWLTDGGFTGCFVPLWFVSVFWATLTGLLIWRIIAGRRGKNPSAFPVDFSDKGGGEA